MIVLLVGSLGAAPVGRAAPAAQAAPAGWQKGAVVINFGPDPYRPSTAQALDRWRATGGNWVAISPVWYMDTRTSTAIYPDERRASPSDASVRRAIGEAQARGLRVMLKPYFDVKDLTWRAEIAPRDTAAWWASYRAFLFHYLDMATELGVGEFALGTEMISMTKARWTDQWRRLIADARARYPGKLTYSANWGKRGAEYQQIDWWDQLDYIGISAYFPLSLKARPSLDELVAGWTRFTDSYGDTYNWVADIGAVQARAGKPVLFTEIGFGAYPNTAGRWDVTETKTVDLEAQRRAYEATLRVWSAVPWMQGIYWWYWDTDPAAGGAYDRGQTPLNKPAADVLTAWFGGTGVTAAPAAPSPQPDTLLAGSESAPVGPAPAQPAPYAGHPAFAPTAPFASTPTRMYFAASGHSLGGGFLEYWQTHGGLDLFGYPISEEFAEVNPSDGRTYQVQYFERERFEYHPENPAGCRVLLGLLGVQVSAGRQVAAFARVAAAPDTATRRYFAATGHTLAGGFLQVWTARGGLPIFGYPLSEEFRERNPLDGQVYVVQYFERARFEYHPEHLGSNQSVQLGLLGRIVTGR
jgi:hypothetical protein